MFQPPEEMISKRKNHNPNLFGHSQMIVKSGNQYFGHHDPRSITGLTLGL
jgi:hypothetical protein